MAHNKIDNRQVDMFQSTERYRIDKPIRLIELFAGYGSQALALKYLGVPFEHWCISEWAIKSIKAYKNLHFTDSTTDYAENMTDDEILDWLTGRISSDYNTPLTREQIAKKNYREIYNEMCQTNNHGSITEMTAGDLNIINTHKYEYILTYSFPCQDISIVGDQGGMKRGDATRSGLLWEVERLLRGCDELPQVLLMENVAEVISDRNIADFKEWVAFLKKLGYSSKYQVYNTSEFRVPQNRERLFMVSVLGDYDIKLPPVRGCDLRLKDVIEQKVDDKYFLQQKTIDTYTEATRRELARGNHFEFRPTRGGGYSLTITTKSGSRKIDNFLIVDNIPIMQTEIIAGQLKQDMHNQAWQTFPGKTRSVQRG